MDDFRVIREAARVDPEWAVIDRIWTELDTPYRPDPRLRALTPGQRAVYSLTWIRAEVINGGFRQCFDNSTAYLLPDAIEGARTLGSPAWERLLERAAGLFGPPFQLARETRRQLLEQFPLAQRQAMDSLDDAFFDLDAASQTNLDVLIRNYIDHHPDEFFHEPDTEEQAVEALLDGARTVVNRPRQRDLALARELLEEAASRSRACGLDRTERLAESLLAQLPDLAS